MNKRDRFQSLNNEELLGVAGGDLDFGAFDQHLQGAIDAYEQGDVAGGNMHLQEGLDALFGN